LAFPPSVFLAKNQPSGQQGDALVTLNNGISKAAADLVAVAPYEALLRQGKAHAAA
jgi:hypothetical protein